MGCAPSRMGPQKERKAMKHRQNRKVSNCNGGERDLHTSRILMINNDVEPTKGRQGVRGGISENFKAKSKNNNQKRPRSLLAMLLGGTPKIDTCKSSAEKENELICDNSVNIVQCADGQRAEQADQFRGLKSFMLDNTSRIETTGISSQLQMPIGSRKRKSFNQANSGASTNKMHITETDTVDSRSESTPGDHQEIVNMESQSQSQTSAPQSVASSTASFSPESQVDENKNGFAPIRRDSTDVIMFTSIHQLCSDIIQRDLLHRSSVSANNMKNYPNPGKIMCLFIFGCQGSAKGEVAYELVEHSDLTRVLKTSATSNNLQVAQTHDCPLYHHIDVAAIIAANIDERIHEYHQLSTQAAISRQRQVDLYNSSLEFSTETMDEIAWKKEHPDHDKENSGTKDDRGDTKCDEDNDDPVVISDIVSNESDKPSITSNDSSHSAATSISKLKLTRSSLDDESNLITLSTKQRSILQLKLMKYFKSITSKWVFSLIQREIERLELRLKQSLLDTGEESSAPKMIDRPVDRIYLINLVPNQLSLFKSCLYLQQDLQLWDFCYPVWALKFERRTNIKLLHKERAINPDSSKNDESSQNSKLKLMKIPRLKLPKLNARSTSAQSLPSSSKSDHSVGGPSSSCGTSSTTKELGEVATSLLVNGVNEKLGPKFNDSFAQQFKHMNKLSKVRYNPIRDYNYSLHDDQDGPKCWRTDWPPETTSKLNYDDDDHGGGFTGLEINDQDTGDDNIKVKITNNLGNRTDDLGYRPMDRIISSSMQHLQDNSVAANTMAGDNLDEIRHRLSLSRISNSPLENVSSPALSVSKDNQLVKPGSQVSLFLSSTSSLVSNDTVSTVESEGNLSQRLSSAKQGSVLSSEGPIKWVIGLEMYENKDSSSSLRSKKVAEDGDEHKVADEASWRGSSSAGTKRTASGGSLRPPDSSIGASQLIPGDKSNFTTIYFHEPKSSRSPLMFTAQHQRRPVSYQLVPVRVAYANDQSQVQFELTRTHPPTIRLKSHSDILRLVKLIGKAKVQVSTECQTWLYAALIKEGLCSHQNQQKPATPQQQLGDDLGHLNSLRLARKRHSATKLHQFNPSTGNNHQQPALIVYVIRVDISRLKSGHFHHSPQFVQQSQNFCNPSSISLHPTTACTDDKQTDKGGENKRLVPILTLQSGSPDELPDGHLMEEDIARNFGNQRPSSSGRSAFFSTTRKPAGLGQSTSEKPKRRVQFRLSQAPQGPWAHGDNSVFGHLKPERRLWLEDCTYLSSKWDELNLETMELLAAMLRFAKK